MTKKSLSSGNIRKKLRSPQSANNSPTPAAKADDIFSGIMSVRRMSVMGPLPMKTSPGVSPTSSPEATLRQAISKEFLHSTGSLTRFKARTPLVPKVRRHSDLRLTKVPNSISKSVTVQPTKRIVELKVYTEQGKTKESQVNIEASEEVSLLSEEDIKKVTKELSYRTSSEDSSPDLLSISD